MSIEVSQAFACSSGDIQEKQTLDPLHIIYCTSGAYT